MNAPRRESRRRALLPPRALGALVLVGEVTFVTLIAIAMGLYPGGTWRDRGRVGHAFWHNFLCDLAREPSLGGHANAGARLASAALIVQAATLLPLWLAARELCPRGSLRARVSAAAVVATVSALAVPLIALAGIDRLHASAIALATMLALLSTTLVLFGFAREPSTPRPLIGLGAALLVAVTLDFGVFARETWYGGELSPLAPAIQKLAALLLVAWASAVAMRVLRQK